MLLVYWYLRALRLRCDLLLQGKDITLEIVEHFIQKTKIYRQADNGNDMNNFEVAQALSRLGNYQYLFHNEPLQALTTYQESYDRHALILSSTHPSTLRIQFTLACLFYDFGNYHPDRSHLSRISVFRWNSELEDPAEYPERHDRPRVLCVRALILIGEFLFIPST